MFSKYPKVHKYFKAPLEQVDHTELDTSEMLYIEDTQKYQSLIGSLKWDISLGRFDICINVMTMTIFISAPRQGHMDQVKRVYAYLDKTNKVCIQVWKEEPY